MEAGVRRASSGSLRNLHVVLLVAILVAAAAVRIHELNSGLWIDEIMTQVNYAGQSFRQIVSTYDSENQHFFYSLLAHASFLLFGVHPWALRLPAVILGLGSIWALYLVGREVSTAREALLSAGLLAFSYHHLWFSQNARGYTGLLFWALLASYLFLRGLRERGFGVWLLYGAAIALGIYTHLTMVFVLVGHGTIYLLSASRRRTAPPNRWTSFPVGLFVAGLMTLLLYAPSITQVLRTIGGTEVSVVEAWKNPLWTVLEFVNGMGVSFAGAAGGAVALLIFVAGFLSYARTDYRVLALLFLPALTGAAATLIVGHHLWPRFFFFAFGFAVLVVIRGVMAIAALAGRLLRRSPDSSLLIGTVLCVLMIVVSSASMALAYGPKQDYGGALEFVQSQSRPGDVIVAVGLAADVYAKYYRQDWEIPRSAGQLSAIRSRAGRTWVLYTFTPVLLAEQPDIMASIQSDFRLVREFPGTVRAGTVFVGLSDGFVSNPSTVAGGGSVGGEHDTAGQ